MKPIIEYLDYRQYILDYYTECKRESGLTWRKFASLAGYSSGSYLKLVCDGKTRLTTEGAAQTATAMRLVGFKFRYFVLMVEYDNAKDQQQKELLLQELVALGAEHRVRVLNNDSLKYFESWKNPVFREIAPILQGASAKKMASLCYPDVSAEEVSQTLAFLEHQELIVKDEKGCYHQTGKSVSTGDLDEVPEVIRGMHRQMGQFALKSLDELPETERCFSGLTLGITKEAYEKILEELTRCRRRIVAIATETDETEQVYRLNLQLFPLTRILKNDEN